MTRAGSGRCNKGWSREVLLSARAGGAKIASREVQREDYARLPMSLVGGVPMVAATESAAA
jgi:hypothetical protein